MVSFAHLLKRVDFDAIIGHLALTHIIKKKKEPATIKVKRLLEVLSSYSFNLYYIKDKDMTLGDFLSRQKNDKSDPHEIIPISFTVQEVLNARYYSIHKNEQKRYLIQTRSQAKTSGYVLPEVHGVDKGVDPNIQPEKQIIRPVVTPVQSLVSTESKGQYHVKSRLGQSRAGIKKNVLWFPIPQPHDKPEPKLLPGRKPIIQIAERPILQPHQIIMQPTMISKVPLKGKSIF